MSPRVRRVAAEGAGTGALVAAVVGSGISASRLSGDVAVALTANALATGAALFALIAVLGPISGAHLNPVVTLVARARGELDTGDAAAYAAAQVAGGILGAVAANLMYGLPVVETARTVRSGGDLWFAEVLATVGLLVVATTGAERSPATNGALVGAWIAGAYFSTSSTSFANPAVTVARSLTDTFAGIAPASVPAFVGAQVAAAVAFALAGRALRASAGGRRRSARSPAPSQEEAA